MGALVLAPQEAFAQLGKLTKKIKEKAGQAVDQTQTKPASGQSESPSQAATAAPAHPLASDDT